MKKVLFIINTLRMGGAEKSLISLLHSMDPKRYDVTVLVFEEGGILEEELPQWVHLRYAGALTRAMILEFRFYGKDLLKSGRLLAYLSRIRVSLNSKFGIHQFSWDIIKKYIPDLPGSYDVGISYLEGYPAYYLRDKVQAKKKMAWIHTDMSRNVIHKEEKLVYKSMDQIFTISETCRESFVKIIPEIKDRIIVFQNIVNTSEIISRANRPEIKIDWTPQKIHVVTVASLEEVKGIDLAVKACAELIQKGFRIEWHVYGKGSQREYLLRLIRENELTDCFFLDGVVKNPYPYMKEADIIVQSSRYEGKSIVLDEAKCLAKPIVVTNYPSVRDQIDDKKTGLIVDIDPEAITIGIEKIITNDKLKNELISNCKNLNDNNEMLIESLYKIIGD